MSLAFMVSALFIVVIMALLSLLVVPSKGHTFDIIYGIVIAFAIIAVMFLVVL